MEGQYKLGYCSVLGDFFNRDVYLSMRACARECERFVLGIPDEYVMARLFGDSPYCAEDLRRLWLDCEWVDDVIILDVTRLSKRQVYAELKYDVCFYGAEYGRAFEEDRAFMAKRHIAFRSLVPENRTEPVSAARDAVRLALNNVQPDQKIVLVGTGEGFDYYMQTYGGKYAPAYAVDSAEDLRGTKKAGVEIKALSALKGEKDEEVLVVICDGEGQDVLRQLEDAGLHNYRFLRAFHEAALIEEFALAYAAEMDYVDRAQDTLEVLLREFARVCEKYGLRYYMICGTLIGVIRHRDIIPWDDDIDVAMPREDYEKLKKIAREEWDNETFKFLHYDELGNGAFLDFFPRLFYLKGEKFPVKLWKKVKDRASVDMDGRLWIDIYILDNASRSERRHKAAMNLLKAVYVLCMGHRAVIDYTEYESRLSAPELGLLKIVHRVGRCLPGRMLMSLYDRISQYAAKKECDDYCMANLIVFYIQRRFKQTIFGDGVLKPFRDFEVRVPDDYDGLLNAMGYGGYMQFPRLSVRKPSHYFNTDIRLW